MHGYIGRLAIDGEMGPVVFEWCFVCIYLCQHRLSLYLLSGIVFERNVVLVISATRKKQNSTTRLRPAVVVVP